MTADIKALSWMCLPEEPMRPKFSLTNQMYTPEDFDRAAIEVAHDIYGGMSFSQKWEQVLKRRETAWALKAAGIRSQHPEWSEQQVQDHVRQIFLYATT